MRACNCVATHIYIVAEDRNDALSCQLWSNISPAAEGSSQGTFLPLQSDSNIAVKLDTGVLLINIQAGTIKHAAFSKGKSDSFLT